jgi:hypothetical protein
MLAPCYGSGSLGTATGSEASSHREKLIAGVGTPVWNTFREPRFIACRRLKRPYVGVRLSGLQYFPYRHTYDTGLPQQAPNHRGL